MENELKDINAEEKEQFAQEFFEKNGRVLVEPEEENNLASIDAKMERFQKLCATIKEERSASEELKNQKRTMRVTIAALLGSLGLAATTMFGVKDKEEVAVSDNVLESTMDQDGLENIALHEENVSAVEEVQLELNNAAPMEASVDLVQGEEKEIEEPQVVETERPSNYDNIALQPRTYTDENGVVTTEYETMSINPDGSRTVETFTENENGIASSIRTIEAPQYVEAERPSNYDNIALQPRTYTDENGVVTTEYETMTTDANGNRTRTIETVTQDENGIASSIRTEQVPVATSFVERPSNYDNIALQPRTYIDENGVQTTEYETMTTDADGNRTRTIETVTQDENGIASSISENVLGRSL